MKIVNLYKNLPDTPGVYLMKDAKGRILYIGKAGNLRRRVSSYFQKAPAQNTTRPPATMRQLQAGSVVGGHDYRIEKLVGEIRKIDHRKADSALEALILESALIKKHQPPYNIREKDDKSFLYVEVTKEKFPRVFLVRGRDALRARSAARVGKAPRVRGTELAEVFGPFTYASNLKEALRIIRRIFPWNTHPSMELRARDPKKRRPCFNYEIGMCPGACTGELDPKEYAKTVRYIRDFFRGKKQAILKSLEHEMKQAAKTLEFEKAVRIRGQVFALRHIRDTALINNSDDFSVISYQSKVMHRIEGYDISNISGTSAVGSMVVFTGAGPASGLAPDKDEYRKFRIRWVTQSDDTGMLREVIERRLGNDWPLPDLMLVDGGKGQVHAVEAVLSEQGMKIPVVGIAKGRERKKNEFVGTVPKWADEKVLIRVRNEAHRFAITYHRALRGARSLY